jgi:hypothetical protein
MCAVVYVCEGSFTMSAYNGVGGEQSAIPRLHPSKSVGAIVRRKRG